jgi:hypothetical protein
VVQSSGYNLCGDKVNIVFDRHLFVLGQPCLALLCVTCYQRQVKTRLLTTGDARTHHSFSGERCNAWTERNCLTFGLCLDYGH